MLSFIYIYNKVYIKFIYKKQQQQICNHVKTQTKVPWNVLKMRKKTATDCCDGLKLVVASFSDFKCKLHL